MSYSLEMQRPFLSQRLWVLFFVYRAFLGRLSWRVVEGKAAGKLPPWDRSDDGKDDAVIQMLTTVLASEEIVRARPQVVGGPHLVIELLEQRILAEIEKAISGGAVADLNLSEGQRLADALRIAEATFGGKEVRS